MNAEENELTEGALERIINGEDIQCPIFQFLEHKKIPATLSGDRYRLLVADGKKSYSMTILATNLNDFITENRLTQYSVIRIVRYVLSRNQSDGQKKKIIIILGLEILKSGEEVGRVIGDIDSISGGLDPRPSFSTASQQVQHNIELNRSSSFGDKNIFPINALSPYQNKWVIKARVTNKTNVRSYVSNGKPGKLFSMDLVDESGEIRCTGFTNAVDKFYDFIEINKIYYITKCTLKPANKKFNHLCNDYEMSLNDISEIILCVNEDEEIPRMTRFNFIKINEIQNKQKDDYIDVLGIVVSFKDVQTLYKRGTETEFKKRDLFIVDETGSMISLTIWDKNAEDFDGSNKPVIVAKGAKVEEFNDVRSLSLVQSSVFQINPDYQEAQSLRDWYRNIGHNEEFTTQRRRSSGAGSNEYSSLLTFNEVKKEKLGIAPNKANIYYTKATVNLIKGNYFYKSCPVKECKKKVIDLNNGMYRCDKCAREFPNFKYQLLLQVELNDWTDDQRITIFNEEAELLLNISAQHLGELKERDETAFNEVIEGALFNAQIFKIQIKPEIYNGDQRFRHKLLDSKPIDYKEYNDCLLNKIKDLIYN